MPAAGVGASDAGGELAIFSFNTAFCRNSIPVLWAKSFLLKHDFAVLSSMTLVVMMRRAGWRGRWRYFRLDFWQGPSQDTPSSGGVQAAAPAVDTASERFA